MENLLNVLMTVFEVSSGLGKDCISLFVMVDLEIELIDRLFTRWYYLNVMNGCTENSGGVLEDIVYENVLTSCDLTDDGWISVRQRNVVVAASVQLEGYSCSHVTVVQGAREVDPCWMSIERFRGMEHKDLWVVVDGGRICITVLVTAARVFVSNAVAAGEDAAVEFCRHAVVAVDDLNGGLRGGLLLNDLIVAEVLATNAAASTSYVQTGRLGGKYGFRTTQSKSESGKGSDGPVVLSTDYSMLQRRLDKGADYLVEASEAESEASTTLAATKVRQVIGKVEPPV
ncbi:hypothetical protein POM88_017760 [Heracleum sosnowskyi]|uniref:Uncharacterized protein n=1 Tax=Heracleum sosnowskyi TaxID=360622 RepID=A0AAD8MYK3_9APIA|nr:hypothetical protein POM88_017760 [Heracleum sosnowskyi]